MTARRRDHWRATFLARRPVFLYDLSPIVEREVGSENLVNESCVRCPPLRMPCRKYIQQVFALIEIVIVLAVIAILGR